jgi:poly(3-hydroxybutyrate) depolymerase
MRILLVHVHPAAEGTTWRHFQYWQRAGYERIVGITTEGGGCYWPNNDTAVIGPNRYIEGDHLCKRLIRTLEYGVNQGADEIAIIEHDAVFFKAMPQDLPKGYVMNLTGGNVPPWKCTRFFHNVWHMDAETAK